MQPGPLLFQTQATLVWGLIASLYIGNILLLVLNLPLIGLWVKVLSIPKPLLYGGILVFATLGAYSLHQSVVDLVTLYVFGLLGFVMRRWGFPVAPVVIGLDTRAARRIAVPRALVDQPGRSERVLHIADIGIAAGVDCRVDHRAVDRAAGATQDSTDGVSDLEPPRGGNESAAPRAAFSFWRVARCDSRRACRRAGVCLPENATAVVDWPTDRGRRRQHGQRQDRRAAAGARRQVNGRSASRSACIFRPMSCARSCDCRHGLRWQSSSRSCSAG